MNQKTKNLMMAGWWATGIVVTGFVAAIVFLMLSVGKDWYRPIAIAVPLFLFFLAGWIRHGRKLRSIDAVPDRPLNAPPRVDHSTH
jgi:hypothetical protein